MKNHPIHRVPAGLRSLGLLAALLAAGGGLAAWKFASVQQAEAAAGNQPEHGELVAAAVATERAHRGSTTAIGTVLATRSIQLRNEIPGTIRHVRLTSGQVVEAGTVLVALDASVEEAELRALLARAELAETTLARMQRMNERRAASAIELDNARAERDVARAQIASARAVIARKTIRAPFRARVGIADMHPGQFIDAGTLLTTLQGVEDAVHVDFAVAQAVAGALRPGDVVEVTAGDDGGAPVPARIVAVDARVEPTTRNATVRARIDGQAAAFAPGASVRVRIPVGAEQSAVAVPVSALRKGPAGDHVYVLAADPAGGEVRARFRRVQAGPVLGNDVVILDGLAAGEQVAASGSFKLRDGALVYLAGAGE
jgi:membrane fusion protein, multidrug efflux system